MKNRDLLNPALVAAVASLGHTEYCCIADCGLPIPGDVKTIDVSVSAMVPNFLQVLEAIVKELVVESIVYAEEIKSANPEVQKGIQELLPGKPFLTVPHTEFKTLVLKAKFVVRTGEASPYANVILVGGVNF